MQPVILVDADACPVKQEVYKVARRHQAPVKLVTNAPLRLPRPGPAEPPVEQVLVGAGFDAADDWIAEAAGPETVVVTADILLAERCLTAGAAVLAPTGKPFTERSIGAAVATRAIMADLRAGMPGDPIGGPPPFSKADRSRFLSALHETLERMARRG